MLRRSLFPLLIQIDGEQRGAGVEHAGERSHQRGEQSGDHDAANARGQQILHHHGESAIRKRRNGLAVGTDHGGQFGNLAAASQGIADQAWNDEQIDGEQLQERGEDAAAARDRLVGRAQRALHDVLVGAPVPQPDDGRAEQHAEPREVAVEIPGLLDHLAGRVGLEHGRPGALDSGGNQRLPEVEHVGAAPVAQFAPAAQANPVHMSVSRAEPRISTLTCTASL